jgi:hypothetical protein
MRILPLHEIEDDDVLAVSLVGPDRRVILPKGTPLTAVYRGLLADRGYWALPVVFPGYDDVEPVPWAPDSLVQDVVAFLLNLPPRFNGPTLLEAERLAGRLIEEYWDHPPGAVELFMPRDQDSNPAILALNRALLVIAGGQNTFPVGRLPEIVLAALLMDAGPGNALAAREIRDPEDPADGVRSVEAAVAYLRTVSAISFRTLGAIRQAYARWDGSGQPPLKASAIYEGAQLLAPANRLARLVMPTTDHPALPPHEALEWVLGGADTDFARPWLLNIRDRVAPYATGSTVQVSNGQLAVVTHTPLKTPMRPRVRWLTGPHRGQEWDLQEAEHRSLVIMNVHWRRSLDTA